MIVVVGGGITFLALNRGGQEPVASDTGTPTTSETEDSTEPEDSEATTTTEPSDYSEFHVLGLGEFPEATPEELLGVMQDNPLTEGTLPDVGECELPATPVKPSTEELQAVLDASAGCLNRVWSVASSDRGLPWTKPEVVVYTWPDIPSSSACEANTFDEDFPRMCNLDSTIYWPEGYGMALELKDEAHVPGAYLWDLAYMYSNATSWNSTLVFYQGEMRNQLEDTDTEGYDDAWRRNALQWVCWASAATMQVPKASQPSQELRDVITSPDNWSAGEPPQDITPENRAHWIEAGFESGGDLAQCNTWTAEVDTVSGDPAALSARPPRRPRGRAPAPARTRPEQRAPRGGGR
jgi:predicted metalloprotease